MTSISKQFFTLAAHQKPTVGDTKTSLLGLDHLGWLVCDGRYLKKKEFGLLFNVIGYQFGSNVDGDFALPDPAGRVPGFVGSGSNLTTRDIGDAVGEETHVLTVPELAVHTHGVIDPGHTHTNNSSSSLGLLTQNGFNTANSTDNNGSEPNLYTAVTAVTINSNTTGITLSNTGSNQPHNNMQPTLFLGNLFVYSGKAR